VRKFNLQYGSKTQRPYSLKTQIQRKLNKPAQSEGNLTIAAWSLYYRLVLSAMDLGLQWMSVSINEGCRFEDSRRLFFTCGRYSSVGSGFVNERRVVWKTVSMSVRKFRPAKLAAEAPTGSCLLCGEVRWGVRIVLWTQNKLCLYNTSKVTKGIRASCLTHSTIIFNKNANHILK